MCFSGDDFNTMIFATVTADRNVSDLKKGILAIGIFGEMDDQRIFNNKVVMIESKAYFEV